MSTYQLMKSHYFRAMKLKSKTVKDVLSTVLAKADSVAKESKVSELSDEEMIKVIQSEIKQIDQSIEGAEKANRPEEKEKYSLNKAILVDYLPEQATDEQLKLVVESVLLEKEGQNFGAILKEVSTRLGGAADNKRISQMIKKLQQ